MYLDREDSIALLKLEVKNREELLNIYDKIIEVVRSFDGKPLNVRLEKALREIDVGLHAHKDSFGMFEILYFVHGDGFRSEYSDSWLHLQNKSITLFRCTPALILKDNCINGELMVDSLNAEREYLRVEVENLRNIIPRINDLIAEQQELVSKLNEFRDKIPYLVKDYVGELTIPPIY